MWLNLPQGHESRRTTLFLHIGCNEEASRGTAGLLTLVLTMKESWQFEQSSYHPGAEPEYKLTHPNIHLIKELLEHVMGPDLEIKNIGAP